MYSEGASLIGNNPVGWRPSMKKVHIFDLGVTQYVGLLRDAETSRLIKIAKKGKKSALRNLSLRNHSRNSS